MNFEELFLKLKCCEIFYNDSIFYCKCLLCKEQHIISIQQSKTTIEKIDFFNHLFNHFQHDIKLDNNNTTNDPYIIDSDELFNFAVEPIDFKPTLEIEFYEDNLKNENNSFSDYNEDSEIRNTRTRVESDKEDDTENEKSINVKQIQKLNEKNSKGLYSCPDCNKEFKCYTSIFRHRRDSHLREANNPQILSFEALNAGYTKGMKIAFEKSEDGFYHCSQCEFKNERSASLRQHIRLHIASEKCVCNECGKVFSTSKSLKEHLKVHTGEKPYECKFCEKRFSNRSNWTSHVRTHTQEKKHQCDYCDKRFIQRTQKTVHERIHLNDRRYVCEICSKQFITMQKLKVHINRHNNIKNYECDICRKTFFTNHELKEHKVIHTNTRPHKCNICGKGFACSSTLRSHKHIHFDAKNYACKICDQKFTQRSGLYRHFQSHKDTLSPPSHH